jgi:hypothetical protein
MFRSLIPILPQTPEAFFSLDVTLNPAKLFVSSGYVLMLRHDVSGCGLSATGGTST